MKNKKILGFLLLTLMAQLAQASRIAELERIQNYIQENKCSKFYYEGYNGTESAFVSRYSNECAIFYFNVNINKDNKEDIARFFVDLALAGRIEPLKRLFSESLDSFEFDEVIRIVRTTCLSGMPFSEYERFFESKPKILKVIRRDLKVECDLD